MTNRFPKQTPSVAASGLRFPEWVGDDEFLVQYQGFKDVSQFLTGDEPAIYLIFFDGFNTFNISKNYKLEQQKWEQGRWYYIHNNGEVEMSGGHNPMQDLEIYDLGKTGTVVEADFGKIKLEPEPVAIANYTKLNNPFRRTKHDPVWNKEQKEKKEKKTEKKG